MKRQKAVAKEAAARTLKGAARMDRFMEMDLNVIAVEPDGRSERVERTIHIQIDRHPDDHDTSSYGTYLCHIHEEPGAILLARVGWFQFPRSAGPLALLAKALKMGGFDPCKMSFRELSPDDARELKGMP